MIIDQQLADWLTQAAKPFIVPFAPGPYVREFGNGDNVGTVTMVSGNGTRRGDLWDTASFQVRLDYRDRDHQAAKDAVWRIDKAVRELDTPLQLWGIWITAADRVGPPPFPLQIDEHQRNAWFGNYYVEFAL